MHSLMTVADAAELLEVSPARVRALIQEGHLPARKMGNTWALERWQVLARTFQTKRAGRPLSAAKAWDAIIGGTADALDAVKYRLRGRALRFPSHGWVVNDVGAGRLGGLVSGLSAAREYLEPVAKWDIHVGMPDLSDAQDVYLPESQEDSLIEAIPWSPNSYGRAVVRMVPDNAWETVLAASPTAQASGADWRMAPPLAVALDLREHSEARSHSASRSLAAHFSAK